MKRSFDAEARARANVRELHPYTPGEQPQGRDWVKLNTNESPYPPSPKVAEAVAAEAARLRLYPEPTSARLRAALAERFGLPSSRVIVGNGSDNILDLLVRCFGGGGVGHTVPSYSLYPVVAGMSGSRLVELPFDRSMRLDPAALAATGASVFFLTSPNAPTGVAFPPALIAEALDAFDGLLVCDEAYVDFGAESAVSLLAEYENLCVARTFSKSHGLAGMRVGYGLASEAVIGMLDRVRDAYNVDRIAQAAALAALADDAWFDACRDRVIATRERTRERLDEFGWFTYPSAANFLFTEPRTASGETGAAVARDLFAHLRGRRVLVRHFPDHPLTCAFIRVSVGTDEQMDRFLEATSSWRGNG